MAKKRQREVTDEQIIESYRGLLSGQKVAAELGVGESTIYRVLTKHAIPTPGLANYREKITRFQGQEQQIRAWYEAGDTHDEIRVKLGGGSDYAIKHAIKRAGGELRPNPVPTLKPGELKKIVALHANGLNQSAIARKLGRSQSWMWRTMRDNGIDANVNRAVGERHGGWKGGRMKAQGYWRVLVDREDALAEMRNNQGYVLEHRLVMARSLDRPLTPRETVHHINGDRADNRLENLQLRQGKHGKGIVACCLDCGSLNIGTKPITED